MKYGCKFDQSYIECDEREYMRCNNWCEKHPDHKYENLVNDPVEQPWHYASKSIEVIDYIKDTLTPEQYQGYLLGNVIKYVSRYQKKNGREDLKKAAVYLRWLTESMGESND